MVLESGKKTDREYIMQQENLQELMNFIQATVKLSEDEIYNKIDEELGSQLSEEQIVELKKQVIEIKKSLETGDMPNF